MHFRFLPFLVWTGLFSILSGATFGEGGVIRFCPGFIYYPGRSPLGTGTPQDGFAEVARSFEEQESGVRIRFEMVPGSR